MNLNMHMEQLCFTKIVHNYITNKYYKIKWHFLKVKKGKGGLVAGGAMRC